MEMAADENLFVIHTHLQRFTGILKSAACEWFLIFLLLIDAALSYVLTKFAEYCKLQTPCILCSRLDHVIGSKKPGFYWNLLCSNHIFEISSLIFCHIHDKLADGFETCEDCLYSFTKKKNLNSEILGGKLDIGGAGLQSSLLNQSILPGSVGTRPCSCCNKLCRSRQNAQRLLQIKSGTRVFPISNIPSQLPRQNHVNCLDNLKNMRSKVPRSEATSLGKRNNESKITSDYESVVIFSINGDGRSNICEKNQSGETIHQCASKNSPKATRSDFLATKTTSHSCNSVPLLSDLCVQRDHIKGSDVSSLSSGVAEECIPGEVDGKPANQNPSPFVIPDLTLLVEGAPPSNVIETPNGENTEKKNITIPHLELKDSNPIKSNFLDDTSSLLGVLSENSGDSGSSDIGHECIDKQKEVLKLIDTSAGSTLGNDTIVTKSVSMKTKDINASNADKLASSNKEAEPLDIITEKHIINESDRMDEEPKLLLYENSSAQQNKSSLGKVQINSSSSEIQTLPKSASLESGLDTLDGSNISEIEGESTVDRFKRQIEYDKKCINALYKELEEERNAAAVATDEAMAMITRLQEEKAALNMEALQYLRMMEEQAEHDVDALEKANDLLAEKEKEIQDLEAELDYYRMNFPEETTIENLHEGSCDLKEKGNKVNNVVVTCKNETNSIITNARNGCEQAEHDVDALEKANDLLAEKEKEIQDLEAELDYYRMKFPEETTIENLHEENCDLKGKGNEVDNGVVTCKNETNSMNIVAWNGCDDLLTLETQCLEFEDEKSYISQCLKRLEGRIRQMSFKGTSFNTLNDGHSENITAGRHNDDESGKRDEILINANTEEHRCDSNKEDLHVGDGNTVAQENALVSDGGDDCLSCKEKNHIDSDRQKGSFQQREIDLDALENEISDLNDRLEALEADHDFLEHMLNTLQNGKEEGLQFIQEIAQQLQDLRKAGIRSRCQYLD